MPNATSLPAVVRACLDAYDRRDVSALVACVTDDVVFENVSNSGPSVTVMGRQAFADLATRAASLFSVRHQTVRSFVAAGEAVALEIGWTGTPIWGR